MIAKVLAVVALVTLPLSVVYWQRSHSQPFQYRYDLTPYQSMWVYLKDGVCGLEILSMPTMTASRTEFRNPLRHDRTPNQASLLLSSQQKGPYRTTWIVFPLWLSTGLLTLVGVIPIIRGPVRRRWRRVRGHCAKCAYDLTGNRSGRCPECGTRVS